MGLMFCVTVELTVNRGWPSYRLLHRGRRLSLTRGIPFDKDGALALHRRSDCLWCDKFMSCLESVLILVGSQRQGNSIIDQLLIEGSATWNRCCSYICGGRGGRGGVQTPVLVARTRLTRSDLFG